MCLFSFYSTPTGRRNISSVVDYTPYWTRRTATQLSTELVANRALGLFLTSEFLSLHSGPRERAMGERSLARQMAGESLRWRDDNCLPNRNQAAVVTAMGPCSPNICGESLEISITSGKENESEGGQPMHIVLPLSSQSGL